MYTFNFSSLKMLIYLIGYMGCGKTTAGKKLASKLGYSFIDLDELIESNQNKSIANIFEDEGQEIFRKIEREALHTTFNLTNSVISTGGGAPCFFDNIEQMNSHGKTVYIQLSPKALVSRLSSAKNERPLIKGKSDDELLDFIEKALLEREPFYIKAQYRVKGLGLSADSIIEAF